MPKKGFVSGAQIVQAIFAIRSFYKTLFWAAAIANLPEFAV
jgi:hypothetical protein